MEKKGFWPVLAAYLKARYRVMVGFLLFLMLFWLLFFLLRLPYDAVLYGSAVALAGGILYGGFDFSRFLSRHRLLTLLREEITVSLDRLPPPRTLLEEDSQALIRTLSDDRARQISKADAAYQERMEYDTLWAHQIKTPIAAMRLVLQGIPPTQARAELEQSLFQIEQYVEMTLHYLRLQSDASDLLLKRVPLFPMVREAVKKYSMTFIRKNISLRLTETPCTVLTDEKWFTFVLEQLLSNSLKYTPAGGSISIYLDPQEDKSLVIEDTGIGIRPEDVPRVFEKGFTGYNGRMDKKSTGLGLYLCRQTLKRLSHRIFLSSQVGKGTRMKIDLSEAAFPME